MRGRVKGKEAAMILEGFFRHVHPYRACYCANQGQLYLPLPILAFLVGLSSSHLHAHHSFPRVHSFEKETVLITGGASGIGRALAQRFARWGAGNVILLDINREAVAEAAAEARSQRPTAQVFSYACDLGKRDEIRATLHRARKEVGSDVTILINNAGIIFGKTILNLSDAEIDSIFEINIKSHYTLIKECLPHMIEKNHGQIVTMSSVAGLVGVSKQTDYSATKFAAFGLTESLRGELASQGITGVKTTLICPYYISTGMFKGVKTRVPSVLPILKPDVVADRIFSAIRRREEFVCIPAFPYLIPVLRLLPVEAVDLLNNFFGGNAGMDSFVGRDGGKTKLS